MNRYSNLGHVDAGNKGLGDPSSQELWSLINHDVSLPAAVINLENLNNNIVWMQGFAELTGVKFAPHGKTSMTPLLFRKQMEAGAWGLTIATSPQAASAAKAGVKRILMANQLIGQANMAIIAKLIKEHGISFYCLVDSVESVSLLGKFFDTTQCSVNVLVEMGVEGGRCGCRDHQTIDNVIDEIAKYQSLKFAGLEFYEGVIHGENAVDDIRQFLQVVCDTVYGLYTAQRFDVDKPIVSGAGSAWYDLVAVALIKLSQRMPLVPVIRPGCYITHDTGIYEQAQNNLLERSAQARAVEGRLENALTVWGYVQSIPENGAAIIGIGKRDIAYDAGLPKVNEIFRQGKRIYLQHQQDIVAEKIMDQHLFVTFPASISLCVGDIVSFSCSHPCLTFDKWRYLCIADENYNVIDVANTCF